MRERGNINTQRERERERERERKRETTVIYGREREMIVIYERERGKINRERGRERRRWRKKNTLRKIHEGQRSTNYKRKHRDKYTEYKKGTNWPRIFVISSVCS